MKSTILFSTIATALSITSVNVSALSIGDILTMDGEASTVTGCIAGELSPETGNCQIDGIDDPILNVITTTGSYFNFTGSGSERAYLSSFNGIIIGETQLASDSHAGPIDGSESPNIDNPFVFVSNTGMHQSTSPITVISSTELDFSGWGMTWNGISNIPFGGCHTVVGGCDADGDGIDDFLNTGIATISITGDRYILNYTANIPVGDASSLGGIPYDLYLEGTIISAVPVPAAVWLFGTGLIGLAA